MFIPLRPGGGDLLPGEGRPPAPRKVSALKLRTSACVSTCMCPCESASCGCVCCTWVSVCTRIDSPAQRHVCGVCKACRSRQCTHTRNAALRCPVHVHLLWTQARSGFRVLRSCHHRALPACVKGAARLVPSLLWQTGTDTAARLRTMHCPVSSVTAWAEWGGGSVQVSGSVGPEAGLSLWASPRAVGIQRPRSCPPRGMQSPRSEGLDSQGGPGEGVRCRPGSRRKAVGHWRHAL